MNNILYPGERLQEFHVPPLYAICSRGQNPHIRAHKHNSWCENKHNIWFPLMEASVLFSLWTGGCMKNYLIEIRYPVMLFIFILIWRPKMFLLHIEIESLFWFSTVLELPCLFNQSFLTCAVDNPLLHGRDNIYSILSLLNICCQRQDSCLTTS